MELVNRKQNNQHASPPSIDRQGVMHNKLAQTEVRRRLDSLADSVHSSKKRHEDALLTLGKEVRILQSRLATIAATGKTMQSALAQDSRVSNAETANIKAQLESMSTQMTKIR